MLPRADRSLDPMMDVLDFPGFSALDRDHTKKMKSTEPGISDGS
jgi:hypothetical protein